MDCLVRDLSNDLIKKLKPNKALIVSEAPRIGKTVLAKDLLGQVMERI